MSSGHDAHDAHDDHGQGHDDHGHGAPADDMWVVPPIVVGVIIGIVIAVVVGTGTDATSFVSH